MKKLLSIVLAMLMVVCVFSACGSEGGSEGGVDAPAVGNDETYSTGVFSVTVPAGWKAFPVIDIFAEEENATDPEALQICKGGETEFDLFSKPYVQINYYGPETSMMTPTKDWYDEAEDIDPIVAGNLTWNGFTATSLGSKIAVLWTTDGDVQYQASVYLEASGGSIGVDDEGLIKILSSLEA